MKNWKKGINSLRAQCHSTNNNNNTYNNNNNNNNNNT